MAVFSLGPSGRSSTSCQASRAERRSCWARPGPGGPGPARGRPTPGRRRRHFCFRVDWRAQAVRANGRPLPLGTRSGAESRRSRPLWAVWALGLNRIPGVATVLLEPCLRPQSAHAAFAGLGVATVLQQARCVASPKRFAMDRTGVVGSTLDRAVVDVVGEMVHESIKRPRANAS